MAVTYYYNVYLQQHLNGVWVNIETQTAKINFIDFKDSGNVQVSPTDQAGNQLGSQSQLQWAIKAYKKDGTTVTQLNDDQVRVVKATVPANPVNDILDGIQTWNKLYFTAQINKFVLNLRALKFPYVITPSFTVTHKGATGFPANGVSIPRADIVGKDFTGVQTVSFTKAEAFPAIPKGLIAELDLEYAGAAPIRQTQNIHYDSDLKQYVGIKRVVNTTTQETTYFALYYNPGANGTKVKEVEIGKDPKKFLNGSKGPAYKAAMAVLIDAIVSGNATNVKVPKESDKNGKGNVSPREPQGKERWNPPPHIATKGRLRGFEWVDKDNSVGKNNEEVVNRLVAAGELGRIYQDKNSATAVNLNPELSKKGELWGFRFMYNPTTISYQTSGVPYDYTDTADVATLLTGNMQVSLQLYLNRIVDLTELTSKRTPTKSPYTPPLSNDAKEGILNRGTEYDIEFLYRVCNGDPSTTTGLDPLLGYPGITADSGLLKLVPVWLHLHNSYKIFGAVSNLSVNHVLFDKRMVPMLSTVDITINRYPAIFNNSDDPNTPAKDAFKKRYGGQGQEEEE
jgi:hypothetical protein